MKALVTLLNSLDDYFETKSDNEKWMMIGMMAIVIGYVSYTFFYPYAEEKFTQAQRKNSTLQKSISSNKQYLQSISQGGDKNFRVKQYDNEIKGLEKNINSTNDSIGFISENLEKLSPLMFNKENWSKFLNSITKQAKNQTVKINYIENTYVDNNGSFGHVLQTSVGCTGTYKHITKFINRLESSVLVTDIYGLNLYSDQNNTTVSADINISVWGVNH